MIIRVDRFFIQSLKKAGHDLEYSELKNIYRESRKVAERERQKNRCEIQLEFSIFAEEISQT